MKHKYKLTIDKELLPFIQFINQSKTFKTVGSCVGHGKYHPTIFLKDRNGNFFEFFTRFQITPERRRYLCFYERDAQGFFFNKKIEDFYSSSKCG